MSHASGTKCAERDVHEAEGSRVEIALVWLGLMVLLGATVGVYYLSLGAAELGIALGVAGIKVVLVMRYYMHLKYRSPVVWLFAGAGFFWLIILFGLTLSDYFTRHWVIIIQ